MHRTAKKYKFEFPREYLLPMCSVQVHICAAMLLTYFLAKSSWLLLETQLNDV